MINDAEDGLRRQVREETGVEVSVGRLAGVYRNMPRGIVALVLRRHPDSRCERLCHAWMAKGGGGAGIRQGRRLG
ncbi:hypothetical protein [Streptomyces sp. SP17BM10]|uniref:hypothetical protein n=1 Tax=Streptomyces sp. SP17BM10 TaxID=3002530 RepID=UPI002E75D23E|nr:hypothetical protein [Streptomyces sp. SP17BM10]